MSELRAVPVYIVTNGRVWNGETMDVVPKVHYDRVIAELYADKDRMDLLDRISLSLAWEVDYQAGGSPDGQELEEILTGPRAFRRAVDRIEQLIQDRIDGVTHE